MIIYLVFMYCVSLVLGYILTFTNATLNIGRSLSDRAIILPKADSEHFRNIIIRSMIKRHADYIKNNDTLRASAMAMLLEKLEIPVNEMIDQINKK